MITLNPQIERVLSELERFGEENDRMATDRAHKMLNLERPTAELLYLLVTSAGRKKILEIGTSNGYSAIWLSIGLRETRGERLITIERSSDRAREAQQNFQVSGVDPQIEVGDATEICKNLAGPFDCVFFDADRISAPEQLEILLPKLTEDALLLADNVLSHPEEIARYRTAIESSGEFDSMIVPVGKGLQIAHRRQKR